MISPEAEDGPACPIIFKDVLSAFCEENFKLEKVAELLGWENITSRDGPTVIRSRAEFPNIEIIDGGHLLLVSANLRPQEGILTVVKGSRFFDYKRIIYHLPEGPKEASVVEIRQKNSHSYLSLYSDKPDIIGYLMSNAPEE